MFKSKIYSSEPFTIDGTVATSLSTGHTVDEDTSSGTTVQGGDGINIDTSSDSSGGASHSSSTVSRTVVEYTREQITEMSEKCETEAGLLIRLESNPSRVEFYPEAYFTEHENASMRISGKTMLCGIAEDIDLSSIGGVLEHDRSVCVRDCGTRNSTSRSTNTQSLNQTQVTLPNATTTVSNNNSNKSNDDSSSGGLSGGAIAGIVIGSIAIISIIGYLIYIKKIKNIKNIMKLTETRDN